MGTLRRIVDHLRITSIVAGRPSSFAVVHFRDGISPFVRNVFVLETYFRSTSNASSLPSWRCWKIFRIFLLSIRSQLPLSLSVSPWYVFFDRIHANCVQVESSTRIVSMICSRAFDYIYISFLSGSPNCIQSFVHDTRNRLIYIYIYI